LATTTTIGRYIQASSIVAATVAPEEGKALRLRTAREGASRLRASGRRVAAARDRFDNGDVRRLRKLDRTRPIDAAVALALAVQGATIEQPVSVYNGRGLIVI